MSNSYLMGAMLDPLVVEFMSPEYCEAMLEAKIRTDEIRGNCPPRAGYVCVLDPRVKTGRYYRKQVAGEGVNALPPSRIEKALAQQEQRSQKGEGISFFGKAAIAGGLAVGGLAVIGAIANSGRSTEPVPDIPNAKKPDTSVKPKSSTYEEAKESATKSAKEGSGIPDEVWEQRSQERQREKAKKQPSQDVGAVSPEQARRLRGSINQRTEEIAQKLEALKQAAKVAAVPSVATAAVGAAAIAQKPESLPVINGIKPKKMTDFPEVVASGLTENLSRTNISQKATIVEKASKGFPMTRDFDSQTAQELGLYTTSDLNQYLGNTNRKEITPEVDSDAVTAVRVMYGLDGQKVTPVSLTKTTQVTPNPEVTAPPNPKNEKKPSKAPVDISSPKTRSVANDAIKQGYESNAIADVAGMNGYKSLSSIKNELSKKGLIRTGEEGKADLGQLIDNNMLIGEDLLVQKLPKNGRLAGYGKDNVGMIRVPAFMSVESLSNGASSVITRKGDVPGRVAMGESMVEALSEKIKKSKDLTESQRNQLVSDRARLTDKINKDKATLQKDAAIAQTNKPAGQSPKLVVPEFKSPAGKAIVGILGSDRKEIAMNLLDLNKYNVINKQVDAMPVSEAGAMAEYLKGLNLYKIKGAEGAASNRTNLVKKLEQRKNNLVNPSVAIAEKPPVPPAPVANAETFDLKNPPSVETGSRPPSTSEKFQGEKKSLRALAAAERAAEKVNNPSTPKPPVEKSAEAIAPPVTPPIETSNQNAANAEGLGEAYKKFLGKKKSDEVESLEIEAQDIAEQVKKEGENNQKKALSTRKKKLTKYQSFTQGLNSNEPPVTPTVEVNKQAEVKAPKAKKEKSSKKQAPKPEDFPIDIPTITQNVKIMENDLQKNEGRLEALRRKSVSQPEKVAMLEKIIEKQKKEIQDKQQEVFDYIQSLSKKQNNDAIAPHETYYSAKEQAKRDALRRFAA